MERCNLAGKEILKVVQKLKEIEVGNQKQMPDLFYNGRISMIDMLLRILQDKKEYIWFKSLYMPDESPDNEVNTPIDKVYDVIVSEDLEALIFKVNLHLRKGGKLLGSLAIERHFNMQEGKEVTTYAQTVLKE